MKHWLIPIVAFAAFSVLLNQVFERVLHVSLLDEFRASLAAPGIGAALMVVLLLGSDVLLPVPSSIVMILSGVLFGTFYGGLLSLGGSVAGNWIGYELMRRYGWRICGRLVERGQVERMQPVFNRFGAAAVILSRPVPVMMETLSFVAGLMNMSRVRFLGASLLGTAPVAFIYSRAGAASWERETVLPAVFVFLCIPAAAWIIAQKRLSKLLV